MSPKSRLAAMQLSEPDVVEGDQRFALFEDSAPGMPEVEGAPIEYLTGPLTQAEEEELLWGI